MFPSAGDTILVQWLIDGRYVWWRATVLHVEESTSLKRRGEIIYHKFEDYPESEANVVFSTFNRQRFVVSVDSGSNDGDSDESSWMFSNEIVPSPTNVCNNTAPSSSQVSPSDQVSTEDMPSSAQVAGTSMAPSVECSPRTNVAAPSI